jgi:serine protease Do
MKTYITKKIWAAISVLVLAALACQFGQDGSVVTPAPSANEPSSSAPTNNGGIDRSHLMLSTVQVMMEKKQGSDFEPVGSGSGTIISADGLILTNAHVASPSSQGNTANEPDRLTIAITQSEDQPPVLSYVAEVRAVDGALDLAVLQIVSTLNGSAVNKSDLNLSFVPLGNSDNVHIGDHLNIFGYPGVGKDTITYTEGSVAGFTSETPPGERAWIKTAVNVAHGNSGGLVANDQNEIIGVPTWVEGDCNQADTNGDGQIDTCVPNGNAINYLRPVNFALPLIKASQTGQSYQSQYPQFGEVVPGGGQESFSAITWVKVDDQGNFGDEIEVSSYPSGSPYLVGLFKFSGMTNGETWSEVWSIDGKESYRGSVAWDQGPQGKYYTFMSAGGGKPLPDGAYHVELFAGTDTLLTKGDVSVGGGPGGNNPPASAGNGVTLYGIVTDADTNKPVSGALVIILKPGVTFDQWYAKDLPKEDVFTFSKTDSKGYFIMPTAINRNQAYTVVGAAEGYNFAYGDNIVWTDKDPDKYEFNFKVTK